MKTRLPTFDVLVDMARNDPQGLETLRRSLTEAVISAATNDATKRRLKGLQFRVDMERARAATPLAIMLGSFRRPKGRIHGMRARRPRAVRR